MTTYPHRIHLRRPHVNLWIVATVVLAAALVGLGSWFLVDRYTGGSSATQDATTLIDDLNVAWSTGDANAAAALYTSDAAIRSLGDTMVGTTAIRNAITQAHSLHLTVERVAPVTLDGDFATSFVRISNVGVDGTPILTVWQLRDGKILRQWGFGIGQSAPFDNAVIPIP